MQIPRSAQVRHAVNTLLESFGREPLYKGLDELKEQQASCFVTLHKETDGEEELRGCIGTLAPVKPSLFEEIRSNALSAAFSDPRFPPLRKDELKELTISVDVLEPSEPIASPDQLDPAVYGVIVEKGYRRGVLLPDLEGVDTVERQLEIARMKAGIGPDDEVTLQRFRVTRYH
ncbi:MAG: AmmeMemoRadiSam system protein A [Spirochaetales bacterium]|nr:AmmeMemoRadiSam system protein A [Spirochaetales bacterium]